MNLVTEIQTWFKSFGLLLEALRKNVVYVVRNDAIGDVLWTEPVISELATLKKQLVFITKYPQLFQNYPSHNVKFVNRSEKKYKRAVKLLKSLKFRRLLVDLNNSYEKDPRQHFLHVYQKMAGLAIGNKYPKLYLSEDEKHRFENLKPYVVIHLESESLRNYRKVYGIDWQRVVDYINEQGFRVYFISKVPPSYKNAYHIETSLRDIISLINNSSFFIGIDSGPSHIAASLQIPAIIFFGAVNPWYRHFPEYFKGIIMQQDCEYSGCYHRVQENLHGLPCLLVGDEGVPKCSVHNEEYLIANISRIISNSYMKAN
jgi:ADP-heptose:LPS heptosyltransferase